MQIAATQTHGSHTNIHSLQRARAYGTHAQANKQTNTHTHTHTHTHIQTDQRSEPRAKTSTRIEATKTQSLAQ